MPVAVPFPRAFSTSALVAVLLLGAAVSVSRPHVVHAQSAQKYAFQVSALSTSIRGYEGTSIGGVGIEPQLRFNRFLVSETAGVVSLGVGGQYTTHNSGGDELSISGVFLEPRWVPNTSSTRFFPYLAGRVALLRQSNNFGSSSGGAAYGAGAGLAIKVSRTVNLDAGVALVRQQFGDFTFNDNAEGSFLPFNTYAAKFGASFGFPSRARTGTP